jgi:hypothetical protein
MEMHTEFWWGNVKKETAKVVRLELMEMHTEFWWGNVKKETAWHT